MNYSISKKISDTKISIREIRNLIQNSIYDTELEHLQKEYCDLYDKLQEYERKKKEVDEEFERKLILDKFELNSRKIDLKSFLKKRFSDKIKLLMLRVPESIDSHKELIFFLRAIDTKLVLKSPYNEILKEFNLGGGDILELYFYNSDLFII